MTFIKSHAEALTSYTPIYVGSHRVDGITLPEDRTYAVNDQTIRGFVNEVLFRKFRRAPSLISRLRSHSPRVVHAHFGDCGPAAMTIANALDIPFIVTFHGQDATQTPSQTAKTYRGRELLSRKAQMIERVGVFIAVSNHIRQCLVEDGYPDEKIVVHRNGINTEFFKPQSDRPRQPIILFVGRFVEKKGAHYLLDAARILCAEGVKFELIMIGSGPLEKTLREEAQAHNLPCQFRGFLDVTEVRTWMSRASVTAVPSVTASNGDSEGLPTVILESQAMATPVVATKHSGIPEGVLAGKTAELVDERDSPALAEKLRSFLESSDKVRSFGEEARRFVVDHFDLPNQVKGLEDIYTDVCSKYISKRRDRMSSS